MTKRGREDSSARCKRCSLYETANPHGLASEEAHYGSFMAEEWGKTTLTLTSDGVEHVCTKLEDGANLLPTQRYVVAKAAKNSLTVNASTQKDDEWLQGEASFLGQNACLAPQQVDVIVELHRFSGLCFTPH